MTVAGVSDNVAANARKTKVLDARSATGIEHIVLVGRWTAEDRPSVPAFADGIEGGERSVGSIPA
jgi:hypothetical protein